MTIANRRGAAALLSAVLLLAACTGSPTSGPTGEPTNDPTTPAPTDPGTEAGLDEETAARLVVARFDAVYGLPPLPPDEIDVDAAGDGVVAPGSTEAERVEAVLNRAIELGVLDRGDVLAEALAPPQSSGDDDATATLCMSQDISTTDLETGEDAGAPAPPDDWLRIRADYQQVAGRWLIAEITAVEPTDCVPPSIAAATAQAWEIFMTARLDHERRGGGPDIGRMEEVVTERFAETLRGIGPFDPPDVEPPAYTSFEITEATRTTAVGEACRDGELEVVEWELVDGQWRIDFAGQVGEEVTPCP